MPAAGFCAAQTAPCDEARLNLAEQTGSPKKTEPEPARAAGSSKPKKDEPPTVSHPRGAERCFAHRTDADACLAIPA
jgi:hypothetical protein